MRAETIAYLQSQNLGGMTLSQDLPFDDSGVPLYLKNVRTVYVDQKQIANAPIVQTLGGVNINNEETSVIVYFALDAKNLITTYGTVVETIKAVKDSISLDGVHTRVAAVDTEYENDLLITQITITLTRIN